MIKSKSEEMRQNEHKIKEERKNAEPNGKMRTFISE
jgi:hypothetical protein